MTAIEALRAEIKRLEARVAELERKVSLFTDRYGGRYGAGSSDSLKDRLDRGGSRNG